MELEVTPERGTYYVLTCCSNPDSFRLGSAYLHHLSLTPPSFSCVGRIYVQYYQNGAKVASPK